MPLRGLEGMHDIKIHKHLINNPLFPTANNNLGDIGLKKMLPKKIAIISKLTKIASPPTFFGVMTSNFPDMLKSSV